MATTEVLARHGVEVVVPTWWGCCGGLAWHTGDSACRPSCSRGAISRRGSRGSQTPFSPMLPAVVRRCTNIISCCVAPPDEAARRRLPASRGGRRGALPPASLGLRVKCHRVPSVEGPPQDRLSRRLLPSRGERPGVRQEPRQLHRAASPASNFANSSDAQICCGSAAHFITFDYNWKSPCVARGERSARAVIATGADIVASGNIGCLTQLRVHLARVGSSIQVRHTMQVLRDSQRRWAAELKDRCRFQRAGGQIHRGMAIERGDIIGPTVLKGRIRRA